MALAGGAGCARGEPAPQGTATPPPTPERTLVVHEAPQRSPALVDRALYARLSKDAQRAVDEAPVPVLVPSLAVGIEDAVVMSRESYYAFFQRDAERTLSLSATRVAYQYPHVAPAKGATRLRGFDGFVSKNEGIRTARWVEDGIAYALDVECADTNDSLCVDEAFIRGLVEGLSLVGGEGTR